MKAWLERDSATTIAEALDKVLVACGPSSCGTTNEGISYGPLIDTFHFSDTLLLWSPDDSWASFAALCSSLKLIVGYALTEGVPFRGSIAHGDVVCNQRTLKFVGQPIAEAYLWAEKFRPFKSVGVDLTPQTISKLTDRLAVEPIPGYWKTDLNERVIRHELEAGADLIWHEGCLFINHWDHGMFVGCDPAAMLLMRNLPVSPQEKLAIEKKVCEVQEFYSKHQMVKDRRYKMEMLQRMGPSLLEAESTFKVLPQELKELIAEFKDFTLESIDFASEPTDVHSSFEDFKLQQADYVLLDKLRKERT